MLSYAPGAGTLLAGPSVVVLLGPDADASAHLPERLWTTVRDARALEDVIVSVVEAGLARVPSFVALQGGTEPRRLIVRGASLALLQHASGDEEAVTGEGATTWVERPLDGVARVELQAAAGAALADGPPRRPLLGGVVDAGCAAVELSAPVAPVVTAAVTSARPTAAVEPDPSATMRYQSREEAVSASLPPSAERGAPAEPPPAADAVGEAAGQQLVQGLLCPAGHPSPPQAVECRICGVPVEDAEVLLMPRPLLGNLVFADGSVVPLDAHVRIGRAPDGGPDGGTQLVTVSSPDEEVSRNHLEVRLDGWHVLIVDLGSTNGTVVSSPGAPPERLRAWEEHLILPGTAVSVADEVSFVYEVAR